MSGERFSLDTNILIYALDMTAGAKHTVAAQIVDRAVDKDCSLSLQSLAEFYAAVTRKGLVPKAEAAAQIEDWLVLFPTLAPTAAAVRCQAQSRAAHPTGTGCWSRPWPKLVARFCFPRIWRAAEPWVE